jgi:hypothetical protein
MRIAGFCRLASLDELHKTSSDRPAQQTLDDHTMRDRLASLPVLTGTEDLLKATHVDVLDIYEVRSPRVVLSMQTCRCC